MTPPTRRQRWRDRTQYRRTTALLAVAVAVLLGFISLLRPVSLPGIIGIVAAGVFLADVRPIVRPNKPNSNGPYGPW